MEQEYLSTSKIRYLKDSNRIDKARTSNLGGTGLGLSIVKTLIEKCGGGLVIDSIEGKGTIFSFYILK